jgi:hypothetical protein
MKLDMDAEPYAELNIVWSKTLVQRDEFIQGSLRGLFSVHRIQERAEAWDPLLFTGLQTFGNYAGVRGTRSSTADVRGA